MDQFQTLHKALFKFVQMKGNALLQEEIKANLKIFFSRTIGPISTKLGTKHHWIKGIHVCSKKGQRPSTRGDTSEIVNFSSKYLKPSSKEPLSQFQPNLAQSILG